MTIYQRNGSGLTRADLGLGLTSGELAIYWLPALQ
jgi:hypothetical protein